MKQSCIKKHKDDICFMLACLMLGTTLDVLAMSFLQQRQDNTNILEQYNNSFTMITGILTFFSVFTAITRSVSCPLYKWDDEKLPLTRVQFEKIMARTAAFYFGVCLASIANNWLIRQEQDTLVIASLLLSSGVVLTSTLGVFFETSSICNSINDSRRFTL